ncbi:larval cuticle protein LCP-17-like [Cydia pomonella]|uniref:larval cuticle protein LCP-17-like n=1 Tax=Cydia pomonella TaxID=82600 RepID=UPI002ADD7E54|nr:larval cuticle protein LCP-17-like [Cydia pomonella]
MRAFIVLALIAAASADVSHLFNRPGQPQRIQPSGGPDAQAEIVAQSSDVRPDGFDSSFQTSNGISAQESGQLKSVGPQEEAIAVSGQFQYTADDGTPIQVSYTADENGYVPQGPHLPTPPPVPEAIARALAYIAAHPPPPEPQQAQKRF